MSTKKHCMHSSEKFQYFYKFLVFLFKQNLIPDILQMKMKAMNETIVLEWLTRYFTDMTSYNDIDRRNVRDKKLLFSKKKFLTQGKKNLKMFLS